METRERQGVDHDAWNTLKRVSRLHWLSVGLFLLLGAALWVAYVGWSFRDANARLQSEGYVQLERLVFDAAGVVRDVADTGFLGAAGGGWRRVSAAGSRDLVDGDFTCATLAGGKAVAEGNKTLSPEAFGLTTFGGSGAGTIFARIDAASMLAATVRGQRLCLVRVPASRFARALPEPAPGAAVALVARPSRSRGQKAAHERLYATDEQLINESFLAGLGDRGRVAEFRLVRPTSLLASPDGLGTARVPGSNLFIVTRSATELDLTSALRDGAWVFGIIELAFLVVFIAIERRAKGLHAPLGVIAEFLRGVRLGKAREPLPIPALAAWRPVNGALNEVSRYVDNLRSVVAEHERRKQTEQQRLAIFLEAARPAVADFFREVRPAGGYADFLPLLALRESPRFRADDNFVNGRQGHVLVYHGVTAHDELVVLAVAASPELANAFAQLVGALGAKVTFAELRELVRYTSGRLPAQEQTRPARFGGAAIALLSPDGQRLVGGGSADWVVRETAPNRLELVVKNLAAEFRASLAEFGSPQFASASDELVVGVAQVKSEGGAPWGDSV